MTLRRRQKVVVLGMMSKMPVPGNIWLVAQYLTGFERLGFDAYYVEAHGSTPRGVMAKGDHDGAPRAASFIAGVMDRFGLAGRWAFHARYEDRYFGMSETALRALYESADLIINLHGSTVPLPEHAATGRLIYLETDPVELEIELFHQDAQALAFLEPHVAFFTWGLNFGHPDCKVPQHPRFRFQPSCPPVIPDFWRPYGTGPGQMFTTVGNWRQRQTVTYQGETYYWSKDREFLKVIDLPARVGPQFELALSSVSHTDADVELLTNKGWRVRDSLAFSTDLDRYREYVTGSHGEFTVAKDQNVRLRSGWFSERSAQYLAAGRPVITQDTAFGNFLPVGEGLFPFLTLDEAADAVEAVNGDYDRHARAAADIARDYFSYDVVLKRILDHMGLAIVPVGRVRTTSTLPAHLSLDPTSRWPTTLSEATIAAALESPIPAPLDPGNSERPGAAGDRRTSIIVVSHDGLAFTTLCLASVLANTTAPDYELLVVDNGSTDGTRQYLAALAARHAHVRLVLNDDNRGFAAANNQGLGAATGDVLILLNNDTIVPPGWWQQLTSHLDDSTVGLVGPVTNRAGNEAAIETTYRTYGELLDFAVARTNGAHRSVFDIRVATMFCVAMRREVYQRVGPLDEQFERGLFEDDDYAMRVREAGYRVVCAEDAFVHHFGQASIGRLAAAGDYGPLFDDNRQRWEQKWGEPWTPYARRRSTQYTTMIDRIRTIVRGAVPPRSTVLVVSRGDDALLDLEGRTAWHFPRTDAGVYSGFHPADDAAAISALEAQRRIGAGFLLVPSTAAWWLDHYQGFTRHLEQTYAPLVRDQYSCVLFDLLNPPSTGL